MERCGRDFVDCPAAPACRNFWPSIANGLIMTFVLLSSSLTMLVAVRAAKSGDKHKSVQWIGFTILLGIIFAGLHLREWFHMFADGWGPAWRFAAAAGLPPYGPLTLPGTWTIS